MSDLVFTDDRGYRKLDLLRPVSGGQFLREDALRKVDEILGVDERAPRDGGHGGRAAGHRGAELLVGDSSGAADGSGSPEAARAPSPLHREARLEAGAFSASVCESSGALNR